MKILLILSFLLPALLFGQITNHFTQLDSKWNVAKTYPAATQEHPNFVATTTTVYGFQGDSTINGETWSKIYSTSDSLFQNNLTFEGLTRKENDLILYKDTLNNLDTLYNFDLEIGDSVSYSFSGMDKWIYVETIDTIQINGQDYRKFKFTEPNGINAFDWLNEAWIEGIGSIHGPLFPHSPTKFSEEFPDALLLTCSFANTQNHFQHPSYSSCYMDITLGLAQQEVLNFNIFPNPVSSILTVKTQQNIKGDAKMYNLSGKCVKTVKAVGNNLKIDVSALENGIYFLEFTFENNRIIKKIVVER